MKYTTALLAFAVVAYGQVPSCATECFLKAVSQSGCGLTDYFCQCTTGSTKIAESVVPCLCTSSCSKAELAETEADSDKICSSALAASGMTYTPASIPTNACAAATGKSTATTTATTTSTGSSTATSTITSTTTSSSMSSGSSTSSMSSGMSSTMTSSTGSAASGNYAAAPTHMGLQGVLLGAAGLAMAAL